MSKLYIDGDYFFYFQRDYLLSKSMIPSRDPNKLMDFDENKKYAYLIFTHQAFEKGLKYITQLAYPNYVRSLEVTRVTNQTFTGPGFIKVLMNQHKIKSIAKLMLDNNVLSESESKKLVLPKSLDTKFSNYYLVNRYPVGKNIMIQPTDLLSIYWTLEYLYEFCCLKSHNLARSSSF